MPTMVQIRNVPDDVHRRLKARAAIAGTTLSEYLLTELRRSLERPTRQEILERLATRKPVRPHPSPAAAVRAERDRR
jgi:plasmid stability protein